MEIYAKSTDFVNHSKTSSSSHLLRLDLSEEQALDKLLFLVKPVVEYTFGIHVGFIAGWLIGLCIGHSYVEHFKPVYFDDLIGQLDFWRLAPCIFARYSAIIGAAVGTIVVKAVNDILLNLRVISMYDNEVYDPNDIARFLGKSVGQIKRRIKKIDKR
jgi:hypothetical protein